ncbi:MAG TPA: hypothetical protein VHY32_08040 [Caulobacteraceae bacterium]|jgi:uncharacterized membrane protein|nr:hypothetical protein [Caulobacteraceae bacterium]
MADDRPADVSRPAASPEPFPHRVEHLSIGEPDPFPAAAARGSVAPGLASPSGASAGRRIDPVMASFDHFVALAGYVLLFLSVFMFGVPALASAALALMHRRDADLTAQSHFRFQLRIFGAAVLLLALALLAALAAGGVAAVKLSLLIQWYLPGASAALAQAHPLMWTGVAATALVVAALVLLVLALVWTLVASFVGFLRLLANRPIGHAPRS